MLEDRLVYINGDFIPWEEATVHMMCHSFGRGSAIFEVLSLHEVDTVPAIFRLDEHMKRLFRTAELLGMELPVPPEKVQEATCETVRRNNIRQGFVKIIAFYPQIAFEILPPQKTLTLSIFAVDPAGDLGGLKFPFEKGTTACISRWRKLDPQTVPIEAKAAANYLNGMVARGEARERGFDHAIMLDTQGFIAEGGTESVFLGVNGRLMTPSTGTVLKSITRDSVLRMADTLGIETIEGRLHPDLLLEAEEVFFSGTPMKVLPARRVEERELTDVPGPLARNLQSLMDDILAGRDKRFGSWLFPLG